MSRTLTIKAGAFGKNLPQRDLLVSPQHRISVSDPRNEFLFGEDTVLVPAKHLVNGHSIVIDTEVDQVSYFHILFDRHEVVWSEGLLTESFHPGETVLNCMDSAVRDELRELFPEFDGDFQDYPAAHLSLKSFEAELVKKHLFSASQ